MAEAIPSVIARDMLSKVLSLAADEVSLAWGFKEELKRLEKSLEMVQALLSDAAKNRKSQLESVGIWLKKLKDVAYGADVVLDEFTYETLRSKIENRKRDKVRALFSPSKNPLSFRLKMAHKIRSINESLDEIYKEGIKVGLVQLIGETDNTIEEKEIRLTHPYVDDESEVVGRDDDVTKIVDMLCSSENERYLSVTAIVGMGGQGKTTLAQLVCKHDKVVKHFDKIIWVCVSEDFDVTRLLNEMVQSLTGESSQLSNVDGIIKKLGEILEGKGYLLVLDDVWNQDQDKWDCLRKALLGIRASSGSRIMVTTRSDQVVSSMQASLTYPLSRLSEEDSWTMFKKRAFAEGGALETPNLEDMGREIVKRCGGLPLAIMVIGSLMFSKKSEHDWLSIKNSQLWNSEDNTSRVLQALKLSYDHLPPSLKHCFALSSVLPKDFVIQKDILVQIWAALGLLHPSSESNLSMEDIGNRYFTALLLNSLLHDAEKDKYGAITSCKMHDLVHDLALETARNDYSTLRSQALISKDFNSQLHLRVLVLDSYSIRELPNSIGKLKHLRYLDISKTSISSLPDTITKLYHLQTLRLWKVDEVPKNIGNLINLRHFCINIIGASTNRMLIGIGQLTSLQTLPFFEVNRDKGCHIKELGTLNNLSGDLTIFGLENVENSGEARDADLSKKSHLRALRLCWRTPEVLRNFRMPRMQFEIDDISENRDFNYEHVLEGLEPHSNLEGLTIENFVGVKFPSWMMVESQASQVLRNLVIFKLENCKECEHIPPLGHLRHLKVVKIVEMDNVKVIGAEFCGKQHSKASSGASSSSSGVVGVPIFPALRELTLGKMPKLERWLEAEQQSGSTNLFPVLEKLNIFKCSSLKTVPSHFPSVIELKISGIDNSLTLKEMSRKLTSLTYLYLDSVKGSELQHVVEGFLGNNRSLRKLTIRYCDGFSHFPINLQTILLDLIIRGCPNLSYLANIFEALESLDLTSCYNLTNIPCLPSVKEVTILNCEKLTRLPSLTQLFPVIEKLTITNCPNMIAFPDMHYHTSLRELHIRRLEKLTSVPTLCTSLRSLQIDRCKRLTSLPELGITLEELDITYCPNMVSFPDFRYLRKLKLYKNSEELDYFPWPSSTSTCDVAVEENGGIQCLQNVGLKGWPEIKSLPEQLRHLSALTYLRLCCFDGVEALPEWLGNLSSLQSLCIDTCKNLKYMPSMEAMRRLTNLRELKIFNCYLLSERCTWGTRPEWNKISHISKITIDKKPCR